MRFRKARPTDWKMVAILSVHFLALYVVVYYEFGHLPESALRFINTARSSGGLDAFLEELPSLMLPKSQPPISREAAVWLLGGIVSWALVLIGLLLMPLSMYSGVYFLPGFGRSAPPVGKYLLVFLMFSSWPGVFFLVYYNTVALLLGKEHRSRCEVVFFWLLVAVTTCAIAALWLKR